MKCTLKQLRARHSMTQEETAKKLNVSTQTYNAWEQNIGMIKIDNANAIANLFNVTLNDIFYDSNNEGSNNE